MQNNAIGEVYLEANVAFPALLNFIEYNTKEEIGVFMDAWKDQEILKDDDQQCAGTKK